MTNPPPAMAHLTPMQQRVGYQDSAAPLTAEQLDAAMALAVNIDGQANTQPLQSVWVGGSWLTNLNGVLWITTNAYLSNGSWYLWDTTQAAYGVAISNGQVSFASAPAGVGPLAWSTTTTITQNGLPVATASQLGAVKVDGTTVQVNGQGVLSAVGGMITFDGSWNAATNTPALASGVGTPSHGYVVNTAGTTSLDGNASWGVGDQVVFINGHWVHIPVVAGAVTSVNGGVGAVSLTAAGLPYTSPVSGAVARQTLAKLGEIPTSVIDLGGAGDGATDNIPALTKLTGTGKSVHFPLQNNAPTTYYLGAFTAGLIDGLTLFADPGVTLSLPTNDYGHYANVLFGSDVSVYFRDISIGFVFRRTPNNTAKPALQPARISPRKLIPIDMTSSVPKFLSVAWPAGDAFASFAPVSTTTRSVTLPTEATANAFYGAFVDLGVGETVSATFAGNAVGANVIGVVVRHTGGYWVYYREADSVGNPILTGAKPVGSANLAGQSLPYPGMSSPAYKSYEIDRSVISVWRTDHNRIVVMHNGKATTQPDIIAGQAALGDVLEVGFAVYNPSANITISGFVIERGPPNGAASLDQIVIYGDSTSASFPSNWASQLQTVLDTEYGLKVSTVTNYAIGGETAEQQYALMQTNGFGSAYYVPLLVGTNDVQGLEDIPDFTTTMTNWINAILSAGRRPIVAAPWMWYTQAQSGGTGQASGNYDQGAAYRMIIERLCAELGVAFVNPCRDFPNPSPALLGTGGPTLLRDNIHQDALGYQLFAKAIADAIVTDYLHRGRDWSMDVASYVSLAGTTTPNGLAADMNDSGTVTLRGMLSFAAPPTVNGTVIATLPRHLWPTVGFNFSTAVFTLAAGVPTITGTAVLYLSAAGQLLYSGSSASMTNIALQLTYQVPWL